MRQRLSADACLIRERAALHANQNDRANHATRDSLATKRIGHDEPQHRRHLVDVTHKKHRGHREIENHHRRHHFSSHCRHAFHVANCNRKSDHSENDAHHQIEIEMRIRRSQTIGNRNGVANNLHELINLKYR